MKNLIVLAACGLIFAGCISHEETVYRDVERTKVEFENEAAGRIFYEKLSKIPASDKRESNTDVSLPIVFEHKKHVVRGNNFAFNEAVARCDTNRDGKITELEARIFAQQQR
jgi:hypothetical protein